MKKIASIIISFFLICLSVGLLISSPGANAAVLSESHSPLEGLLGFPSYSLDTGWLGGEVGVGAYVRLGGAIGGTLASVQMNGSGKLDLSQEKLWFEGSFGSAEMDFGIETWAQYKIIVFAIEYTGDLPYLPTADFRFFDQENYTPYLLGTSLILSDSFSNQEIISYPFGIPGVASVNVGLSLTASASNEIGGRYLSTNRGMFYSNGEKNNVSVSGLSFTVSNIAQRSRSTLTFSLTPNGTIGVTVFGFTYTIDIPTIPIPVIIPSIDFSTSPSRSITFDLPPPVPPPPTGVSASDGTYTDKVRVTWNASSGATSYKVYRSTSSGGSKTYLGSTSSTTYDDTSASVGTTYYYWVKALNSYGESGFSSYNMGYRKLCTYSISPTSKNFSSGGGTGSVSVTAPSGCSWTATRNNSWITITSGSSGTGNGTVSYSISANTSQSSRTGTMTIAGKTFTVTQGEDEDDDGVPDKEEQGPNGNNPNYDGDGDGDADWEQDYVASMHTFDNQYYITLESPPTTTLSNVQASDNPSPGSAPQDVDFPYGFFKFTVNDVGFGGAATVTLHLPAGSQIDTYWKFGPTPGNPAPDWYEFLFDGRTGAEINGNVITLHFWDSERGDDVLVFDDMLIDQGGPGVVKAAPVPSSDGGGGGCLIATAAYGSYMEPHVKVLREFRDQFLITNSVGTTIVDIYHAYSPPLADVISKHDTLRLMVRWSLLPLVGVSWIALHLGLGVTLALMGLLICLIGTTALITMRRMRLRRQA